MNKPKTSKIKVAVLRVGLHFAERLTSLGFFMVFCSAESGQQLIAWAVISLAITQWLVLRPRK